MKILLFVALSLLASTAFSQQPGQLFKSLDKKELMSKLFSGSTFNDRQEIVWKPDSVDNVRLPVSSDGNCYTRLDTFIRFKDKNLVRKILVERVAIVFTTSRYQENERDNCHACAPAIGIATFTKTANKAWKLNYFKKYITSQGVWGKRGKLGVERFGDDLFCLKLDAEFYGQGNTEGVISYFSLSGMLNEVLVFQSHSSNEGAVENGYREQTTLAKLPGKTITIELTTRRDAPPSVTKKIYRYSEATNVFELIR